MKISRFNLHGYSKVTIEQGGQAFDYLSILRDRKIITSILEYNPEKTIVQLLEHGYLNKDFVELTLDWARGYNHRYRLDIEKETPLLPFRPGKIVCVARNWHDHAKEGGHEMPLRPIFFCKTDNCAIGYMEKIKLPQDVGRVDHEGEFAVVIGQKASGISAQDADKFIHSYTILNDVTAREFQKDLAINNYPWYAAKSMDTFAPLGPTLLTPDEIDNLYNRSIRVFVNEEIRQDGTMLDMHWKIPQLMEAITKHITLNPGDIIATGTPSGVSPIKTGDKVTVKIEGLGALINEVTD